MRKGPKSFYTFKVCFIILSRMFSLLTTRTTSVSIECYVELTSIVARIAMNTILLS